MSKVYKTLPSVDQVLQLNSTAVFLARYRHSYIVYLIRQVLQRARSQPDLLGNNPTRESTLQWVEQELTTAVKFDAQPSLRRVINATGVILHTGLGRAPLSQTALEAIQDAAAHYCNLELDLASGQRGSRISHVEDLICQASGAEAATVVNNNAAAVLIILSTLARNRQVIVSRGELVEIGGSFRVPDIIAASGAVIREVGTTNRTHLRDYADAINPDTALILLVHPSNYRVQGFTSKPDLKELVDLSRKANLPIVYDLGGGVLEDLESWNLPHEPVVDQCLQTGIDVVSFSGDKVLGGPQAGIIAGGRKYIDPIMRNPLMRTLRCDKLILAALEASLQLYRLTPANLQAAHPVLRMMTTPLQDVKTRAQSVLEALSTEAQEYLHPALQESQAQAGSGTLPLEEFPSWALGLDPESGHAEALSRRLRLGSPSILGRINQDRLLLDMRTVRHDEIAPLVEVLNQISAP
jgi:L-seryl-tRNA(Ser) seleniumtransferase